jgi:hypothetical protein
MSTVPVFGSGWMPSRATWSFAADSSARNSESHGMARRCTVSFAAAISSAEALRAGLYERGSSAARALSCLR